MIIPVLTNDPKKFTYGEHRKRVLEKFEKNPDDPDPQVQQYKKSLEKLAVIWQPRINADMALARTSALGIIQDTSLLRSIRVVNRNFSNPYYLVFLLKLLKRKTKSKFA